MKITKTFRRLKENEAVCYGHFYSTNGGKTLQSVWPVHAGRKAGKDNALTFWEAE